jgi:hypothetical protein
MGQTELGCKPAGDWLSAGLRNWDLSEGGNRKTILKTSSWSQVWWLTPLIPGTLEDLEFGANPCQS